MPQKLMNFLNRRINIYREYLFLKNFLVKYNTYQYMYIYTYIYLFIYLCIYNYQADTIHLFYWLVYFQRDLSCPYSQICSISTCIQESARNMPKFLLLLRTSANSLAKLELQCMYVRVPRKLGTGARSELS